MLRQQAQESAEVLWWDRNGYCLLYKRLHRAVFVVPTSGEVSIRIDGEALRTLLAGEPRKQVAQLST
ncbi:MAG: transposase [Deltaproteobacteria bacterium]|nr:transposase [Deltaproteobacteria bacterium]